MGSCRQGRAGRCFDYPGIREFLVFSKRSFQKAERELLMSNTPENRKCPCRHPDAGICAHLLGCDPEDECDCNCHREYAEDAELRAEMDFVLNLAHSPESI